MYKQDPCRKSIYPDAHCHWYRSCGSRIRHACSARPFYTLNVNERLSFVLPGMMEPMHSPHMGPGGGQSMMMGHPQSQHHHSMMGGSPAPYGMHPSTPDYGPPMPGNYPPNDFGGGMGGMPPMRHSHPGMQMPPGMMPGPHQGGPPYGPGPPYMMGQHWLCEGQSVRSFQCNLSFSQKPSGTLYKYRYIIIPIWFYSLSLPFLRYVYLKLSLKLSQRGSLVNYTVCK